MKRLLGVLLSLSLLCSCTLSVSAAQAGAADERLTQVTLQVKETLGIGDEFDEFYGNLEESYQPYWSLSWTSESASVNVTAGEDGKVYSYSRSSWEDEPSGSGALPSLPAVNREDAAQTARDFVDRVLTAGESASWDEPTYRIGSAWYNFSGTLLFNGLPTPFTFSVDVSAWDGSVRSFYRSDEGIPVLGDIPSSQPSAALSEAGALLKDTISLRLEYVQDEEGSPAVLRYLPDGRDEYYVDAQTGKLVNLTELYEQVGTAAGGGSSSNGAAESAPSADAGLSEAEQEGIAQLEGVQSREALDGLLREEDALGLSGAELSSFAYDVDPESGEVSARLRYTRSLDEGFWRRTVTVDARTGDILSVSSSRPWDEEEKPRVTSQAARETAERFLNAHFGEEMADCALYDREETASTSYSFRYARQVNGYFFPDQSLRAEVDPQDGTISYLYRQGWDEDVTFDSAEGVISPEAALDAYFDAHTVALAYQLVPVALDPSAPEAAPLLAYGVSYCYELKLAYLLKIDDPIRGVDAKTGAPVGWPAGRSAITYDDLDGCWGAEQAQALAGYGVGWLGGSLRPYDALTQRDLLALLLSVQGSPFDPQADHADDLYQRAYRSGFLTPEERQDGKVLTRLEMVEMVLDAAGYGPMARLEGIYRCDYTDAAEIPADSLGYAALAQGLGLVAGDDMGRFAPGRNATRVEALSLLYQYMNR